MIAGAGSLQRIYFSPHNAANIGVLRHMETNPTFYNIDISSFVGVQASARFGGGVLAPNGCIYYIPRDGYVGVGVLDTTWQQVGNAGYGERFSMINVEVLGTDSVGKYYGGVLAPNGKIYCVPETTNTVGVINTETNTFYAVDISGTETGASKYREGALGPNGIIYFVPYNSDNLGMFDPSTETFSVLSVASIIDTDNKYGGASFASNGALYMAPWDGTKILKVIHEKLETQR